MSEGSPFEISGKFGTPEKKFSIDFTEATQNFVWASITMLIIVICLFYI